MFDDKLRKGARQAVVNCMKIRPEDNVIIVGDSQSKMIMNALADASLEITKNVKLFYLEDYGKRPLRQLPKEIADAAGWSTATFYTASSMPGEKVSLRKPIIKLATAKKGSRQAHMPDVNVKIMKTGMLSDYAVIQKLSRRLYNLAKNAKEIKVVTDAGTFIVAEFSSKIKWIISDGDITKRVMRWGNLPSGEVYTSPLNVNGVFVVDGVLGDWLGPKYGSMERQPLKLTIKNSRVVNAECRNKKLLAEFNDYIRQDSNANRIGEFAIGTNIGLKKLIGEMLQDEKFPGIHMAVGDSYPEDTGSGWGSKAHCDAVISKATIVVDGKMIMKEGKFIYGVL